MNDSKAPPWPEPTVQVPSRIGGWYVVAATKLPRNDQHKNRYTAVVQANPASLGFVFYPEVTHYPNIGFAATPGLAVSFIPLNEAIDLYRKVLDAEYPIPPRSTS
jgi:hypothetical protein